MDIVQLIGSILMVIGSVFIFLGALGIVRMPDLYNRMQAGTKATTLGTIGTLFGLGLYHIEWMGSMMIIIIFIVITNPLSSHALARAAHFKGIPLTAKTITDELKPVEQEENDGEVN